MCIPPLPPCSGRARHNNALRHHDPLGVLNVPLLRARRAGPRRGLAGEQGAPEGVGRLRRGVETARVEGGARAGLVPLFARAQPVIAGAR